MENVRLKILYLITKSNFGGAQRYVFDLATSAKEKGYDVAVAFGGSGMLKSKLEEAGVRTIPLPELERDVNPLGDLRTFLRLLDLLSDESPDVVHLNSSKIGAMGALAARIWNIWSWGSRLIKRSGDPVLIVFTGHGWAFNEERKDIERFLIGCVHWLTIALSHKTIAVSKKTRDQIGVLPFLWHKIEVVHNGVGEIVTLKKQEALDIILGERSEEFLSDRPFVIGTLAELHKNKGLSYAIEGMAILKKQTDKPFLFLVLGEGEERAALEASIVKLGIERSVFLAGYKDNGVALLSAFDVFILPSVTEAFPYAILEAGNAGLPVIASAVGGIAEVIDDMQSGILIQSKNPGEVARAVSYLMDHPDRREEFGRAIRERIRGRFAVEQMASETFALYERESRKRDLRE